MFADGESRRKRKMAEITQALNVTPVDVPALRRMAISEGGLLTDEIRRQVWPRLLNVSVDNIPEQLGKTDHLGHRGNSLSESLADVNQVFILQRRSIETTTRTSTKCFWTSRDPSDASLQVS